MSIPSIRNWLIELSMFPQWIHGGWLSAGHQNSHIDGPEMIRLDNSTILLGMLWPITNSMDNEQNIQQSASTIFSCFWYVDFSFNGLLYSFETYADRKWWDWKIFMGSNRKDQIVPNDWPYSCDWHLGQATQSGGRAGSDLPPKRDFCKWSRILNTIARNDSLSTSLVKTNLCST